jgi:hypothetical protein
MAADNAFILILPMETQKQEAAAEFRFPAPGVRFYVSALLKRRLILVNDLVKFPA